VKRNIEALENSETRETYEKNIKRRIEEAEILEIRDLDSKVAAINEIIKETVEKVIPLAEQQKRKWISARTGPD